MPAHRSRPPDRSWRRRLPHFSAWAWTGALAVLAAVAIGVVLLTRDDPDPARTDTGAPKVPVPTITSTVPPTTPASVTVPPPTWPGQADLPENAVASGNTYLVGADIPAGTYTTAGAADPDRATCYWARKRQLPNSPVRRVVTNGTSDGAVTLTLQSGVLFESQGCKEWHREASS